MISVVMWQAVLTFGNVNNKLFDCLYTSSTRLVKMTSTPNTSRLAYSKYTIIDPNFSFHYSDGSFISND